LLNLQSRDLPTVKFRRVFPEYKSAFGDEAFIEIDARPGGYVNPAYMAATERLRTETELRKARLDGIGADHVAVIEFTAATGWQPVVDHLTAIYDTCIIEWRCSFKDGDGPIVISREKFIELAHEIGSSIFLRMAMVDLVKEIISAGDAAWLEMQAIVKN
jgi:hypothetical protein